jgi:hypothetical protein
MKLVPQFPLHAKAHAALQLPLKLEVPVDHRAAIRALGCSDRGGLCEA